MDIRVICSVPGRATALLLLLCLATPSQGGLGDLLNQLIPPRVKCERSLVEQALTEYLVALTAQSPANLAVTDDVKFTENGHELNLGDGHLWPYAGEILMRRQAIDTQQCAAAAQVVVERKGGKAILGVRLQLQDSLISEIETLYVAPGFFFAAPWVLLHSSLPEWEESLPGSRRSTPVALRAYADTYFNGLDTSGTRDYIPVPFADDCNRWENGIQTTFNNCAGQLKTTPFNVLQTGITHRRFPVMDTEMGIVVAFGNFTNVWSMMEMFLIRDAKIQKIQAVMVPWIGTTGW